MEIMMNISTKMAALMVCSLSLVATAFGAQRAVIRLVGPALGAAAAMGYSQRLNCAQQPMASSSVTPDAMRRDIPPTLSFGELVAAIHSNVSISPVCDTDESVPKNLVDQALRFIEEAKKEQSAIFSREDTAMANLRVAKNNLEAETSRLFLSRSTPDWRLHVAVALLEQELKDLEICKNRLDRSFKIFFKVILHQDTYSSDQGIAIIKALWTRGGWFGGLDSTALDLLRTHGDAEKKAIEALTAELVAEDEARFNLNEDRF